MDNDVDIKAVASASNTPAPPTEAENRYRPSQTAEAAVPEERPNDQRVGKLEQLQQAADEAFKNSSVKLSISYDEASGRFVYKGVDPQTGEIVREFPPEEVLEKIVKLREMTGVNLDREL